MKCDLRVQAASTKRLGRQCWGQDTNPRSFNWSVDRRLRPREFLTLEACHINWCGYKGVL